MGDWIRVCATSELLPGESVLHGSKFDVRDGRALNPPAYAPVPKFPVRIDSGAVWTRDDRDG